MVCCGGSGDVVLYQPPVDTTSLDLAQRIKETAQLNGIEVPESDYNQMNALGLLFRLVVV